MPSRTYVEDFENGPGGWATHREALEIQDKDIFIKAGLGIHDIAAGARHGVRVFGEVGGNKAAAVQAGKIDKIKGRH